MPDDLQADRAQMAIGAAQPARPSVSSAAERSVSPFGAITLKWQAEMAIQNRAQGNRFWLQFYYPL